MDNKWPRKLASKLLNSVACLLIGLTPEYAFAQDAPPPGGPPPASAQPAAEVPPPAPAPTYTQAQLEQMLAPIALYPDALLAQVLPAAAYPLEIVEAARWLDANGAAVAKQDFSGADAQNWDASVKSLVRFPEVIKKMNGDLNWTISLGDATVNQPQDVANVIQSLRAKAMAAGALKTTPQQTVTRQSQGGRDVVMIQSADPSVVYVPSYNPYGIYGWPGYNPAYAVATGLLVFGAGVAIGSLWAGNYWNWGTGAFYRPVWPGYPGWRPPYGGWRPGMPVPPGSIGNGISTLPWKPDMGRYRPGGRPPGLGGVGGVGRPGGIGGIGGVGRPGGVGGVGGVGGIGGKGPGGVGGAGGIGGKGPGAIGGAGLGKPKGPKTTRARTTTRTAGRGARGGTKARGAVRRGGGAPRGFGGGGMRGGGFPRGGMRAGGFRGGGMRGGGMRGGGMRGGGGGRGGRRSDLRLKHDVTLLGYLPNGLGYYRFVYNGGRKVFVGVIAQEVKAVMPDAVFRAKDGYLRVDYDRIGVKFQSYEAWEASGAHVPDGSATTIH
jgi:hypothetical protein